MTLERELLIRPLPGSEEPRDAAARGGLARVPRRRRLLRRRDRAEAVRRRRRSRENIDQSPHLCDIGVSAHNIEKINHFHYTVVGG